MFEAIHRKTRRAVAIKQCFVCGIGARERRFLKEGEMMKNLSGAPNIVQLLEFFLEDGDVFMVQERCKEDLFDFLWKNQCYKISQNEALKILF